MIFRVKKQEMKMDLISKKRISIIIEVAYKEEMSDIILNSGASGFTVYNRVEGVGHSGSRGGEGTLGEMYGNIELVVITGDETSEIILNKLKDFMEDDIHMVVQITDVSVMRSKFFN